MTAMTASSTATAPSAISRNRPHEERQVLGTQTVLAIGLRAPDGEADREREDEDDDADAGQPPGGLAPTAAAHDEDHQRDDRQPRGDVLHRPDSTACLA
jgi:hypothetical protein